MSKNISINCKNGIPIIGMMNNTDISGSSNINKAPKPSFVKVIEESFLVTLGKNLISSIVNKVISKVFINSPTILISIDFVFKDLFEVV